MVTTSGSLSFVDENPISLTPKERIKVQKIMADFDYLMKQITECYRLAKLLENEIEQNRK